MTDLEAAWGQSLNNLRQPDSDPLKLGPGARLGQVREAVAYELGGDLRQLRRSGAVLAGCTGERAGECSALRRGLRRAVDRAVRSGGGCVG